MAKWVWRLLTKNHSLLSSLVHEKYKYRPLFSTLDLQIPKNGGAWRNICNTLISHPRTKVMLRKLIRKKIGDGRDTLFWHDVWLGNIPLKSIFPRLFLISALKNSTVASNCFWDGLEWKWVLKWARPLRPHDNQELQNLQEMLKSVNLAMGDSDTLIWTPHKKEASRLSHSVLS